MKSEKQKQGKQNRAAGQRFELKVRKDLETKKWIVSKWMNNVYSQESKNVKSSSKVDAGQSVEKSFFLGSAKHKFRGPGIPMSIGTGFPDFICFKTIPYRLENYKYVYEIIGVESKMTGVLDKAEKEKCQWLLNNNKFSKILIASKGEKRGEIIYTEFKWK